MGVGIFQTSARDSNAQPGLGPTGIRVKRATHEIYVMRLEARERSTLLLGDPVRYQAITDRTPKKWSRAGTVLPYIPGRKDVKAHREPAGTRRGHWDCQQPPDFNLLFPPVGKVPDPAGYPPTCWGHPVSGQLPSWMSRGAHLKAPLSLAGDKTLEPPALGFQPSPGTVRLHVNIPQHPGKEGFLSGFG